MKQKEKSSPKQTVPALRFPEFVDAGGWIERKLGDIATFINGRAYSQSELLDKGKYRVLRVGNFFSNNNWYYSDLEVEDDKYCEHGDLLYAWSASFGPRIWLGEKVIYHYHIWKVLANELVLKQFLYVILVYETDKIKSQSAKGLGLLHITKGSIEAWKTPIPSLPEQQKIADCLSSLDELIQLQNKKVEALKSYKKGLLQNLFPAEGETVPKLRFPEFEGTGDWEEVGGDFLFDPITNKNHDSSLPILAITQEHGAIPRHLIDYQISVTEKSIESYKVVEPGDFIISLRSFQGGIEYSNYLGICSPAYIILRKNRDLSNHFYRYYFKTTKYIQDLNKNIEGIRDGKMVSFKQFSEIQIPFPSLPEQQKIADCLSSVDALIQVQSERVEGLKSHKKGLLQGLFPVIGEYEGYVF